MTGRERFLTALDIKVPDRVPLFEFLEGKRIFKHTIGVEPKSGNEGDLLVECSKKLGLDAVFIPFGGFAGSPLSSSGTDTYRDEWGTVYKNTGKSWPIDAPIAFPVKTRDDFKRWLKTKPDPYAETRTEELKKAIQHNRNELAIIGGVLGPLTVALLIMGWEALLYSVYDDELLLRDVFKVATDFFAVGAERMIQEGSDVICVAEDLGSKQATFFSPEHYRKHLFPFLGEFFNIIHRNGAKVMLHCDGNINGILEDLVDLGINALHPLERKSKMDIGTIKNNYGHKICLIGNVDASTTLPYGPKGKIEEEVKQCIKDAGKNGGYILASDSDYHDGIPPENFLALIKFGKKYGRYPIDWI